MQLQQDDVLFGMLCTQLGLVSPHDVAQASAHGLRGSPHTSGLADTLQSWGALSAEQRIMVEHMMRGALSAHRGDFAQTLASFGGPARVTQSFGGRVAVTSGGQVAPQPASEEPDADLLAITQEHMGRYQTPEQPELGRGGIGRVILAHDRHLRRDVAVKELLPDKQVSLTDTPNASLSTHTVRFLREARVTGQLEHPNIVPVHELGARKDGTLYYTMKIVRGRTLSEVLGECRTLADRMALLPHFIDACHALAYAHSRGVVHRDIKPDNIMIGQFGETVVLDWGLAKVHGQRDLRAGELSRDAGILGDAELAQTQAGELLGTPLYMSPEQARGQLDAVDAPTDVWSLGAVLYEILTGERAFLASNLFEVMFKVTSAEYRPVRELCPAAPPELAAVVAKALAVDPAARYADAGQLADEVSTYLTGGRVRVYEYSLAELAGRFARKHRAVLAVAAVAAVALVALAVSSYLGIRAERDRANDARMRAEGLVAYLLGDMRQKLEDSGRLELLDNVVTRVQAYYSEYPDDHPDARHLRARASDLVGGIERARGDLTRAMVAYESARDALEPLVAEYPGRAPYRDTLAEVRLHIGHAHLERGDLSAAEAAYQAALADEEALAEREPDHLDWRLDRSKVLAALGELAMARGQLDASARAHEQARDLRQSLVERAPERLEFQTYLAASHEAVAGVSSARGRLPDAEAAYGQAMVLRTALDQADPGNAEWKHALSGLHAEKSALYVQMRDLERARDAAEEAMRLTRWLTGLEPGNRRWQRDLSLRHERLGQIALAQGDTDQAERAFRASLDIMTALVDADPENLEWRRELVVSHDHMADVYQRRGELAQAAAEYQRSVDMLRALTERSPESAEWRRDTAVALNRLGDVRAREHDLLAAETAYREALDIALALSGSQPDNADWLRDVAASHNRVADLLVQRAQTDAAGDQYRAALAILVRLLERDAANAQWLDDVRLLQERLTALGQPFEGLGSAMEQAHQTEAAEPMAQEHQLDAAEPVGQEQQLDADKPMEQRHQRPSRKSSGSRGKPMGQEHKKKDKRKSTDDLLDLDL